MYSWKNIAYRIISAEIPNSKGALYLVGIGNGRLIDVYSQWSTQLLLIEILCQCMFNPTNKDSRGIKSTNKRTCFYIKD